MPSLHVLAPTVTPHTAAPTLSPFAVCLFISAVGVSRLPRLCGQLAEEADRKTVFIVTMEVFTHFQCYERAAPFGHRHLVHEHLQSVAPYSSAVRLQSPAERVRRTECPLS